MVHIDPIMQKAITKAAIPKHTRGKYRHYAILVDKRGMIVGEGANDYTKTHPKFKKIAEQVGFPDKCFCHAEFVAINNDRYKKGYKLYVARVDCNNKPINSHPCPVCWELIKQTKYIKSVEWT